MDKPYIPYIVPFILFIIFTYAGPLFNISLLIIYPLKTIVVATSLIYFWNDYKHEIGFSFDWLTIISGIFVFIIWVLPQGLYPQIGYSEFNPYKLTSGYGVYFAIAIRIIGASLVVPLMEELFWRSFALRYAIDTDFKSVPLGQFSWFSFIFVSVIFGFEHHQWLVGIIAGLVYAGILYRKKDLFVPILSHAITNLLLGVYVVATRKWFFW